MLRKFKGISPDVDKKLMYLKAPKSSAWSR